MTDARDLTLGLGGRWRGRYGTAPCPVCQPDRRLDQNALTISEGLEGRLLLDCKKSGCAFTDILAEAGMRRVNQSPPDPATIAKRAAERRSEARRRADQARRLWRESQPVAGTAAETYLRDARGITCPLPDTLRFHPAAWHGPVARAHPALVALVEGGASIAVHRTYLRPDGSGKADLDPARMLLGGTQGGAVRLAEAPGALVVAEGVETALSLASGLLHRPATIWAALSTSGMIGLTLPPEPARLTIASDGDAPGHAAARKLAERAHATGWAVSLLPAPDGCDWNDVLATKRCPA